MDDFHIGDLVTLTHDIPVREKQRLSGLHIDKSWRGYVLTEGTWKGKVTGISPYGIPEGSDYVVMARYMEIPQNIQIGVGNQHPGLKHRYA